MLHFFRNYFARQYARLYPADMFIGVTGSEGKSACIAACRAVLAQKYKTISTEGDLDPALSIPKTLLKINPTTQKVVLQMDLYPSHVKPKTAIFTKAADELIESLSKDAAAILNWDDPAVRKLAEKCQGKVFFFGTDPQNCTVWAGNIKVENFGTSFELNLGVERVKVNFKLLGLHQVYAALAASLLGVVSLIPLTRIKMGLEALEQEEHRMQVIPGPNNSIILDDTYNSSPAALEGAIDTLMQVPARRRIIVLGQMLELGEYSEKLHRDIARKIYKEKIDFVFLGQGEIRHTEDELKSLGFWEERMEADLQNSQLVSKLLKTLGKGDVCLIKGSRAVRLDEVVKRIAKK